jgi:hypothetical protein
MTNTNMTADLTAETITNAQIRSLRTEALTAGDSLQVELCDWALFDEATMAYGPDMARTIAARQACADAIVRASAQQDATEERLLPTSNGYRAGIVR